MGFSWPTTGALSNPIYRHSRFCNFKLLNIFQKCQWYWNSKGKIYLIYRFSFQKSIWLTCTLLQFDYWGPVVRLLRQSTCPCLARSPFPEQNKLPYCLDIGSITWLERHYPSKTFLACPHVEFDRPIWLSVFALFPYLKIEKFTSIFKKSKMLQILTNRWFCWCGFGFDFFRVSFWSQRWTTLIFPNIPLLFSMQNMFHSLAELFAIWWSFFHQIVNVFLRFVYPSGLFVSQNLSFAKKFKK